jgi:hypothetical protein
MKRVIRNFSTLALVLAMTVSSVAVFANEGGKKSSNNNIPGLEFKYIGTKENQPVFVLNLVNGEEDEYIVSFRDKTGRVLYSDRLKGSQFSKRFLLNIEELGTAELDVEIRSKKTNQVQLYRIGTTQSVVTETVVSKIS